MMFNKVPDKEIVRALRLSLYYMQNIVLMFLLLQLEQ